MAENLRGSRMGATSLENVRGTVLAEGKINAADLDMLVVTDDVDEAMALMVAAREDRFPTPPPERPE